MIHTKSLPYYNYCAHAVATIIVIACRHGMRRLHWEGNVPSSPREQTVMEEGGRERKARKEREKERRRSNNALFAATITIHNS